MQRAASPSGYLGCEAFLEESSQAARGFLMYEGGGRYGWRGSVHLPQCTQQTQRAQQQAHKDKTDSDAFWVKHPVLQNEMLLGGERHSSA